MSREADPETSLAWIRQKNSDRAAAWSEDAELIHECTLLLELQAMRIVELNDGLTLARKVIEQQKKMIATLRGSVVKEIPDAKDPAEHGGDRGGDGGSDRGGLD